jgi:uncharacterized protein YceH (UPF0502 family)
VGIDLDPLEQRIIGALIEKQLTTPDQYPLSLQALVAACNQKSNRDPKMDVESYAVEGAIRALMDRAWVTRHEPQGGRTMRYGHEAASQLGVPKPDLAILSELLCRGPQAPGALKTRCSRMVSFASADEVEGRLADMSVRPVPYAVELERQMRERHARWQHMLGRAEQSLQTAPNLEPAPRVETDPMPVMAPPNEPMHAAPDPAPSPLPMPAREDATPDTSELEMRLSELESRIETLTDRLDRLEGR